MSGLSFEKLSLHYPEGGGIETGALTLPAGRLSVLLGPNGAGKSSLIKALAGVTPADIEGLTLSEKAIGSRSARARQIAYLSQMRIGPGLARVRDVIALGRYPFAGQDDEGRVETVINQLGLAEIAERAFGQLSGGEQARVLLGRALAVNAPVLLADEPTASLDPYYALRIMQALKAEAARGHVVLVSLHDLSLAERFADHLLIADQGRIVGQGTWDATMSAEMLKTVFRIEKTPAGHQPV